MTHLSRSCTVWLKDAGMLLRAHPDLHSVTLTGFDGWLEERRRWRVRRLTLLIHPAPKPSKRCTLEMRAWLLGKPNVSEAALVFASRRELAKLACRYSLHLLNCLVRHGDNWQKGTA